MQLFLSSSVRRLTGLAILLFFTIPFGISLSGCKKALAVDYCNGGDSGPSVGQVATITLSPSLAIYGESLNYGQIGQSLSASAQDCKGNSVSVSRYTFASTDGYVAGSSATIYADINPNTGQVCAGTWNRFTGGGVPDYTTCTAPSSTPPTYLAYVTATANGAVSNAIPVFVHPPPTSIAIGTPTPSPCSAATSDPSSNCCPLAVTAPGNPAQYINTTCLSQGTTAQLTARVYANGKTDPADNITCQVGHLNFAAVGASNIVSIDENGVATANQPGSAIITASISASGSGSTAGYFSTCPAAGITLAAPGATTIPGGISVSLNNAQPFTATVTDTLGKPLTGLSLEYNSTSQQTIPTSSNSVTPAFPGTATITAVCAPGTCNPAPYSQIGYNGNGTALTSNGITVTATGTSSTVIYIGSTASQYLYPVDFTTNQPASLLKLPYVPNSMIINQSGTTIYLGSPQALMTVSAVSNTLSSTNTTIVGPVLSVSPDGSTLVTTDPTRQTISLVSASGGVEATYNGVATRAQWSPDSQTVYITAGTQLLIHNAFTSWTSIPATYNDVAVTVPHVGAYFGGATTDGRSYCPSSVVNFSTNPPTVANTFYPIADTKSIVNDRLASTTDGNHILGATASITPATLNDLAVTINQTGQTACPSTTIPTNYFQSANTAHSLIVTTGTNTGSVTASSITGVVPSTNSAVSFVTYTYTGSGTNTASGKLPMYVPSTGTVSFVPFTGAGATTPVTGVFSSDNLSFYAGTAGDNKVHVITLAYPTTTAPTAVDAAVTAPIVPNLPDANPSVDGPIATPNLIVQRPKKSTN